jgi:hypothetical protein
VSDHHRIVLALEAQLPALREVDFGRHDIWWRYRNTWKQSCVSVRFTVVCLFIVIFQIRGQDRLALPCLASMNDGAYIEWANFRPFVPDN